MRKKNKDKLIPLTLGSTPQETLESSSDFTPEQTLVSEGEPAEALFAPAATDLEPASRPTVEAEPADTVLDLSTPAPPEQDADPDAAELLFDVSVARKFAPQSSSLHAAPLSAPSSEPVSAPALKASRARGAKPSKPGKAPTDESVADARSLGKPSPNAGSTRRPSAKLPLWAASAYWIATPAALAWGGCMAAFAAGYRQPFGAFEYRPYPLVAFLGLCLLPAVFIFLAAYAVRQAAKLSDETRKARDLAAEIAIPAALAADQAGGAAESVRREVDRAAAAAAAAEQQLLGLRRALAEESERLIDATDKAERRAKALTVDLAREREGMDALAAHLGAQAGVVSDAIAAGSRMVSEASDLAAAQLQEAEATLALRAADLVGAAGEAGEAAGIVGQALSGHVERLEAASESVVARIEGVAGTVSAEQARLAALADQLRADQEHIAARIAAQREDLLAATADARAGADEMVEASEQSAGALRTLIAEVAGQVGRIAATAEADQAALSARADASIKLFSGMVAEERASMEAETRRALDALAAAAEEARKAAETHTDAARERVEGLGQAAFVAGQKADQAFDARLGSARRMIEQSAEMVEQAGLRSAERIEQGLAATKGALGDLQLLLIDIDAKVAALPDDTRARAQSVRDAVEQGIGELTAAARKAAEETQAIDAAFQGRIKHNYEMLSEALRLMGKVAGAAGGAAKPVATPMAVPSAPPVAASASPSPFRAAAQPAAMRTPAPAPEPDRFIRLPAEPAAPPSAEQLGLRPRLRLTPEPAVMPPPASAAPPSLASVTAPARPAPAPVSRPAPTPRGAPGDDSEWTWKDLLSSIDEPPMDDEVLAERLIAEIENLGLDASGLLPLNRIDEIAAVLQSGDVEGAREVVRNLAPSAVRRLSRRVLTDKVLHAHADRYLQRYEDLLADSAKRDRDGFVTAALLGSDPGRAFLLFNAAVGELH